MTLLDEATFYRRLHLGNPGDIEFYERVTRGAESVLELGCGWGRITRAFAGAPCVVGLDHNAAFLEEARHSPQMEATTQFLQEDIRSFDLQKYDLPSTVFQKIVIPYNTLYSLGGAAGVEACFKRASQHLAPEGELWFDVYPMDALQEALMAGHLTEDDDEPVAVQDWEGAKVRIFENSRLDHTQQRLRVTYQALGEDDALLAEMSMVHDYLLIDELARLLTQVGLSLLGGLGDFSGTALSDDPEQVILGARHRSASED